MKDKIFVPGEICLAWYYDQYNKLELFYCKLQSVGSWYSVGELFFDERMTVRRGNITDICTNDLVKI